MRREVGTRLTLSHEYPVVSAPLGGKIILSPCNVLGIFIENDGFMGLFLDS